RDGLERRIELLDRAAAPRVRAARHPRSSPRQQVARAGEALLEHDVAPLRRADQLERRVVRTAFTHGHDLGLVLEPGHALEERLASATVERDFEADDRKW